MPMRDSNGMKGLIGALAALIIVLASAFSLFQTPVGAQTDQIIITDDFGRNITIKGVPERIISLSPANTEILFAIGAGDRVVGVTEYCNHPEEAKERKKIGGITTVSIEKVVALEPDLVLGDRLNGKELFERLEQLNFTVVGTNPENISGILDDILLVGSVTGEEQNASLLVADLERRLDEIKNETRDAKRTTVFYNIGTFFTAGDKTFVNEIIERAGGTNIAADKSGYFIMNLEELIDRNPQVIICDSGMGSMSAAYEEIMSEERLEIVDAVKNHRVYVIEGDIMDRAGVRVVDAVKLVHEYLGNVPESTVEERGSPVTTLITVTATPSPALVPMDTPTPMPIPTVSPKPSSFDLLFAVIGLLVVLYLVRRNNLKSS